MSKHQEFFDADLAQSVDMVSTINWKRVVQRDDVIETYLDQALDSDNTAAKRRDLATKLGLIFEQPFFREKRYAKLRDETLRHLLMLVGNAAPAAALRLVRALLDAGADVNVMDPGHCGMLGSPPSLLLLAVSNGASDALIRCLLEAGAQVETCGESLLLDCRRRSTIDMLVDRGARWPEWVKGSNLSHLDMPVLAVVCTALQDAGWSMTEPDELGDTGLHWAAREGCLPELAFWTTQALDLNAANASGVTPLMNACRSDNDPAKKVQLLLDHGVAVEATDAHDRTALMWAVELADDLDVVRTLIRHEADLGAIDCMGNTALHYCAARSVHGHITHQIAQTLLEAGAPIDAANQCGHTALMLLAQNAARSCRVLLKQGARIDTRDQQGYSAQDYACEEVSALFAAFLGGDTALSSPDASALAPVGIRSAEVAQQIQKALGLRTTLLRAIDQYLASKPIPVDTTRPPDHPYVLTHEDLCDDWRQIRARVALAGEGLNVETEDVALEEVDRMSSMLSGPFFLSKAYPMPKGGYPVVQLDLRTATALAGRQLGDGLLQLWEFPKTFKHRLRVIPRSHVTLDRLLPFNVKALPNQDETLLYFCWNSDPAAGIVKVFKKFVSLGVQLDSFEFMLGESENDLAAASPPTLVKLARRLMAACDDAMGHRDQIQLFGSFHTVQYSHSGEGKPVLFTMVYGPSGSAQVFENRQPDGQVTFDVASASR